jgi:GNAT superfamily N-acetyltransferase
MTLTDLEMVLGWARDEGWNPGLDDATAFLAADPEGFFLSEIDGQPAAAISVVNHDTHHAFLGLYICRPEYRGQGIGLALWEAALEHAGQRSVTLDGVPAQQANYQKSGFAWIDRTVRFCGHMEGDSAGVRQATESDISRILELDEAATGHARRAFASQWFQSTPHRQTLVIDTGTTLAFATFRKCHDGVKIGPLHAESREQVLALLNANPFGPDAGALYIDSPASCDAMHGLLASLSFAPVFETARMVKGTPAIPETPAYFAVTTLELG